MIETAVRPLQRPPLPLVLVLPIQLALTQPPSNGGSLVTFPLTGRRVNSGSFLYCARRLNVAHLARGIHQQAMQPLDGLTGPYGRTQVRLDHPELRHLQFIRPRIRVHLDDVTVRIALDIHEAVDAPVVEDLKALGLDLYVSRDMSLIPPPRPSVLPDPGGGRCAETGESNRSDHTQRSRANCKDSYAAGNGRACPSECRRRGVLSLVDRSAVHVDDLAGDIRRAGRTQELDDRCHLARMAEASQRDFAQQLLTTEHYDAIGHGGRDDARSEAVHQNVRRQTP